ATPPWPAASGDRTRAWTEVAARCVARGDLAARRPSASRAPAPAAAARDRGRPRGAGPREHARRSDRTRRGGALLAAAERETDPRMPRSPRFDAGPWARATARAAEDPRARPSSAT